MNPTWEEMALAGLVAAVLLWHDHVAPRLIERRRKHRLSQAVLDEMFRSARDQRFPGPVGLARQREMAELVEELTRGGKFGK